MARYSPRIEETIGFEFYRRWVRYSAEAGAVPDPFVLWEKVLVEQDKYPISKGGFAHWLNKLQVPPEPFVPAYVWRDPLTKAWRLKDIDILEK
jgi:hypothetical protein